MLSNTKNITVVLLIMVSAAFAGPKYVTTLHPFKIIIEKVLGARGEVTSLLPAGASPHTYEMKPSDMKKVGSAKALFYGASNLDEWALKFSNSNRVELIKFVPQHYLLRLKQPNLNGEVDDYGIDPHFWSDPLTVKAMLPAIVQFLSRQDPAGKKTFENNARAFSTELDKLNYSLMSMLSPLKGKNFILTHPFFQYFLKRYGMNCVAGIEPSPGKEPTPKEINYFIKLVKNKKIRAILGQRQDIERPARVIAESSGIKIIDMDSIGGTKGVYSYWELLMYNANILLRNAR
jgi:zinc transport system substrate-binding protein